MTRKKATKRTTAKKKTTTKARTAKPEPEGLDAETLANIQPVSIEITNFTPNQMIALEEYYDLDFQVIAEAMDGKKKIMGPDGNVVRMGSMMQAMAYIKLSETYPEITVEQAGAVPLDMGLEVVGLDG